MAEQVPDPVATPRRLSPKAMKIVLILSLGLNLVTLGVVGGAMVHGMSERDKPKFRDLAFGPFTEALSPEDRQALRRAFRQDGGNPRDIRQEMQQGFADLLTALRAEPFDAGALRAVFAAMQARMQARMDFGQRLLADRIVAMTPEARTQFAERLEELMKRSPKRGDPPPPPEG
ncbi:MAG: hypothetical protein DI533_06495 [Cereibacter sphaeroides]|uniref:Periplasmic heavy metal sensor n=1 Tax=Cereibacter sphaeroides TaxID=1063 RepID=A0A2W5UA50_CERSP|nr:MAG: hypothetical protein DI533_06495 [Cereibacter sphaeroides]